jgi:L-ascorbate metabolism protein UlaG (beta-lactamase superfamily)
MRTSSILVLATFLAVACARAPASARAPGTERSPTLTYLGVAGWQFASEKATLLVDPYFSRPDLSAGAKMIPDEKAIAARAPVRADNVMVGHSHADHLLDTPAVARRTGAEIMGSESTAHYARASGTPDDKIITVKGGEDFEFGAYSVRVIPSLHSALDGKHTFGASRTIPADIALPMTFADFGKTEGGTFAYLARLGGHEVLFLDTANFIERELEGIHPDVAVVATGLRNEIHDYTCRLMHVLGRPRLVFTNHFDVWKEPARPTRDLPDETKTDLARFADEVHACAPDTRVIVPEPFQAYRLE